MAATLGAGVQDGELYAAMAKHDAISVGGENNVCVWWSCIRFDGVRLTLAGRWSRRLGYWRRSRPSDWCVRDGCR